MKLKLTITTLCIILAYAGGISQTIVNGAFESWNSTPYDEPSGWMNSNSESLRRSGIITATKVTGQAGQAIMVETKAAGGDTSFGYFTNTLGDPLNGEGGVPYSQKPSNITGYYKHNLQTGDSAILIVIFKKSGAIVGMDMFKIGGTQSSFTAFSFPLNVAVTPDSVIIAAASSNAIDEVGIKPGSTITFDELAFTGASVTQPIPGGNFDTWTAKSYDRLNNWDMGGEGVSRTTDKHRGDYAVLLETQEGDGEVFSANLSNGTHHDNGPTTGGVPYTGTTDTLVFYYKYIPSGIDTGFVFISLYKNGSPVGGRSESIFAAVTYTRMEVPFNSGMTPDTMRVEFFSSNWPHDPSNAGSKLYVDEVQLKSQPINTGIKNTIIGGIEVYPNPANTTLNITFTSPMNYTAQLGITDALGRLVRSLPVAIENGSNVLPVNVDGLNTGIYYFSLIAESTVITTGNFIKQ